MDSLERFVLLAQNAPAANGPASPGDALWMMSPFLAIGILFYLLLILPERKKARELEQMLKNLKKNDRVVTSGGILGTVVIAGKDSSEVVLRIDDSNNTRIHILRSAIVRVLASEGASVETKES